MPKVSVIIPVYNVEKYLPRCLDSVCNQTLKDIEIICINDFSPDNSLSILNKYAEKDDRFKIINKSENGGLSTARNLGMDIAKGNYIFFLDSDDWIDLDYLYKMYNSAIENDVDVVVNDNVISEKKDISIKYQHPNSKRLKSNSITSAVANINNIICSVCFKMYKRSFIEKYKFRFPDGCINEDLFFHFSTFAYLDKFLLIRESNYHYLSRDSSIMGSCKDKDYGLIKVYSLIFDYYKENNLLDKNIKIFSISGHININSEEKYNIFKKYIIKIEGYFFNNIKIFNDIEIFFIKNILKTSSYNEYKRKFPPNVAISYLKKKRML
jgi:glycosyltransferase involved in cell wall biosynthesis